MKTIKLAALVAAFCLASCTRLDYPDFYMYSRGEGSITGNVNALDVEWVSGTVDICYHDKSTVEFYEDSNCHNPDCSMYYWYDGSTLRIKYSSPYVSSGRVGSKNLRVFLPSGSIYGSVDIESVSANVNADVDCRSFNAQTVSGDVEFRTFVNPQYVGIETVSGNVRLVLPSDAGGNCRYSTVSGMLYCSYPADGRWRNFFFGKGNTTFDIETVSGVLRICENAD